MRWSRDNRTGAALLERGQGDYVVPAGRVAGLAERLRFGESFDELRPYGLLPPVAGGADNHANFAWSTVATAPSPATSGTSLVVAAGDGTKFPAPNFNAVVCPVNQRPSTTNAEIIRCTAKSGDTFSTILRAQEGTTARSITVGDQIFLDWTNKNATDIEPPATWTHFSTPTNIAPASSAVTANTLYYQQIAIPYACTLTGIRLGLPTTTSGNVIAALYDSTGTRVAVSSSTLQAAGYQHVAFTGTYAAASGVYYMAVIYSATPSVYSATPMAPSSSAAQGSFAAPASITLPGATTLTLIPRLGTY